MFGKKKVCEGEVAKWKKCNARGGQNMKRLQREKKKAFQCSFYRSEVPLALNLLRFIFKCYV